MKSLLKLRRGQRFDKNMIDMIAQVNPRMRFGFLILKKKTNRLREVDLNCYTDNLK